MLKGLAIILALYLAGEALVAALRLPLPGNVVGMVLLTSALCLGWVRADDVREPADALLRHLALFFVPPGVGLMLNGHELRTQWLAIVAATVLSTVAVMLVSGGVAARLERR